MSQHDYAIANDSGANVRVDLNNALGAIQSQNSGASAPSDTAAHMVYADTTKGQYRRRNAADSGWLPFASGASTMVQAKTAAYTVAETDFGTLIDCTSGTFTLSLTAAATLGDGFWFDVRNSGTGVITIDPNASETIDGATTITLYPGDSAKVECSGSAFKTVGRGGWEEGSWTPKIEGGSTAGAQTYTTQIGRYIRIGNLVTAWFTIVLSAKDAATAGTLTISGLPFSSSNISGFNIAVAVALWGQFDLAAGATGLTVYLPPNSTAMVIAQSGDVTDPSSLSASNLSATSQLSGSVTYRIN